MKNRGETNGGGFALVLLITAIVCIVLWCYSAGNSVPKMYAVDGYVVVYGKTADSENALYTYMWPVDRILGVDKESDGIDVIIRGQIPDSNIYNTTQEEFEKVWNEAKAQAQAKSKGTVGVCPHCRVAATQPR